MPARKATASGKWSQSIWDVTPGVGDDVFANNFTIEIDQNVNVGSLRTAVSGVYAAAGGTFNVYQPYTVTVSGSGVVAGTTTCLTVNTSGSNAAKVVGAVTGGSSAAAYGVSNAGVGGLSVTGTINGGTNATAYGVYNASAGYVIVSGNVVGSSTAPAIFQNSTGTLLVSGTVTASANTAGVVSSNIAARNEFTGSLVNGDGGRQAVYCAKYSVRPKMFDSSTQHKNTDIVNRVTYSEQLDNAAWTKVASTVTANLTTSPFGSMVADKILEAATTDRHYTYPTISNVVYTTPQVFSIYLKKAERQYVTICNESGAGTNGYSVMYDLTNGTTLSSKNTGTGVLSMSSIENVGDGWYRCALGGTLTTGSGTMYSIVAISNRADYSGTILLNHYASYAGNTSSGIFAYGAQFEYGTTPSAYLSSTDTVGYKNVSVQPVTFYAPEAYSSTYVPHTSSVSLGTAYAAVSTLSGVVVNIPVQLSGTMVVPSISSVALGTLVGSASGVAILNSADLLKVWETNINTLTAANSLGLRLKNAATIQEIGQQIQNINL